MSDGEGARAGADADAVIADLVDASTIVKRLGLRRVQTIHDWLYQDVFPKPRRIFAKGKGNALRVWSWAEVAGWAATAGAKRVGRAAAAAKDAPRNPHPGRSGRPAIDLQGVTHDGASVVGHTRTVQGAGRYWAIRCRCGATFEKRAAHVRSKVKKEQTLRCRTCSGCDGPVNHRGHAADAGTSLLGFWAAVVRAVREDGDAIDHRDELTLGEPRVNLTALARYAAIWVSKPAGAAGRARRVIVWDPDRTASAHGA